MSIFTGDSRSIHRLVLDVVGGDIRARRPSPALANRSLAELLADSSGPTAEALLSRGGDGPHQGPVPFLPRHRLLSPDQKRRAVGAFAHAVETGDLTSGPAVEEFEQALADFAELPHAVAASSGTDAMIIALKGVGVEPGDEVIIPANSFAATENAVFACGATPVLADVDPVHHTIDPEQVEARTTPRTRAVLPVHLYGKLADMPRIQQVAKARGLSVVEDACQAIGVTGVGRHADAAVLSFNPYKNFGLCGKAGAVLTADGELADRLRRLAYHGFEIDRKNIKSEPFGYNSKLDNSMAVVALALLPDLTLNSFRRAFLAKRYLDGLADLADRGRVVLPAFDADHSWHLFTVRVPGGEQQRDAVRAHLREHGGIETDLYYPVLTHRQDTPLHRKLYAHLALPHTELLRAATFQIPLHNDLTRAEQDRVIEALREALR